MASVKEVACPYCHALFIRTVKQLNVTIKRSGIWACKSCCTAKRNIDRAKPEGSTRIHNRSGYVLEKASGEWVGQHVLVMERHIGRKLTRGEVVHHIDQDKRNNELTNLQLMSNADHTALHNKLDPASRATFKKISIANRKLSLEQAEMVRSIVSCGASQRRAGEIYGVSQMVVSRIVRNVGYVE